MMMKKVSPHMQDNRPTSWTSSGGVNSSVKNKQKIPTAINANARA
jgi:hypothetical protein